MVRDSLRVAFGKAVRQRRDALGLPQEVVARKCNIGVSTLSRIETGQTAVDLERTESLAAALGLGIEELMRQAQAVRLSRPAATSGH